MRRNDQVRRNEMQVLRDKGLDRSSRREEYIDERFDVSEELVLNTTPAFSGFIIHEVEVDADTHNRPSVPLDVIKAVQQRFHQIDDEDRWVIALVSDEGLRLGEALVLLKNDVTLGRSLPLADAPESNRAVL